MSQVRQADPDDICPIHGGAIKDCPGHSTATLTVVDAKTKQPKVVMNSGTYFRATKTISVPCQWCGLEHPNENKYSLWFRCLAERWRKVDQTGCAPLVFDAISFGGFANWLNANPGEWSNAPQIKSKVVAQHTQANGTQPDAVVQGTPVQVNTVADAQALGVAAELPTDLPSVEAPEPDPLEDIDPLAPTWQEAARHAARTIAQDQAHNDAITNNPFAELDAKEKAGEPITGSDLNAAIARAAAAGATMTIVDESEFVLDHAAAAQALEKHTPKRRR